MIITANDDSSFIGNATENNDNENRMLRTFQNMRRDLREDLKGIRDIQW